MSNTNNTIVFTINRSDSITGYMGCDPLVILADVPPCIQACIQAIDQAKMWGGPDWSCGFRPSKADRAEWAFLVLYCWLQTQHTHKATIQCDKRIQRVIAINMWSQEHMPYDKKDAPKEMQDLFPDNLQEMWEQNYNCGDNYASWN